MKVRVAIVDDHFLVRAGLKALIAGLPSYEVVAEGEDGSDAEQIVSQAKPDILLLDITMRHLGGLDVLPALRASHPQLRVLMLSMHSTPDYVMRALNLGAAGYLIKNAYASELEMALDALSHGESYLSPAIARVVIARATEEMPVPVPAPAMLNPLTPRQGEVLRLLARGCSTRDMAQGLSLSVKTVETHRAQIMERLQIHDVPSLVRYAIRAGLVALDE